MAMPDEHDGDELRFQVANSDLFELREIDDAMPTLAGHFAPFGEWAQISSASEGTFMEQIAPGAFKKTFADNKRNMRVLFQHGQDPQIGEKLLGPIDVLREDDQGGYYEVPLFDTTYNRDLLPALRANEYGASFRFRVLKQQVDRKPGEAEHNPDGLPERTITEAKVMEFGPVTFPAYEGASAGLRSATDWWLEQHVVAELKKLGIERAAALGEDEPPTPTEPDTPPKTSRSTRDFLSNNAEEPRWLLR